MLNIQHSTDLKINRKVKAVFYGPAGSGKTIAALTFPRALVADSEGGTLLYCGREDVLPFHRVAISTPSDLRELIDAVQRDNGKTWDTLIVDPITVLYDVVKASESRNHEVDMDFRRWGKVNSVIGALFNQMLNLPVHVVVIARESPIYEGQGQNLKVVGAKPDCPKDIAYVADYIIHFNTDHSGTAEKSRGQDIGKGDKLKSVNFDAFKQTQRTGADAPKVESTEDAARRAEFQDRENVARWVQKWNERAINNTTILAALRLGKLSEWESGFAAADEAINRYIESQTTQKEIA